MADRGSRGGLPEGEEIARLDAVWNAFGRGGSLGGLDTGDAETIDLLHGLGATPPAQHAFVGELRERLMNTSANPGTGTIARPMTIPQARNHRIVGRVPAVGNRLGSERTRWLSAVATVVLVAVTIVGLVAALVIGGGDGNGRPTPTANLAAPETAIADTGTATLTFTSDNRVRQLGQASIFADWFPEGVEAPLRASLFDWTIAPQSGEVVVGDQASDTAGVVIDVVVEGIYRATFEKPGGITRAAHYAVANYERVAAGETVELARGDAVVYDYGSGARIENPLEITPLRFESIVLTADNVTPAPTASGDGASVAFNSEGTVPEDVPLDLPGGPLFRLELIYWWEGQPMPPVAGRGMLTIIGKAPSPNAYFVYRLSVSTEYRG